MANVVAFQGDVAGADAPEDTSQNENPRPEGLPEKFQSVEELAKSYSELEQKLGSSEGGEEVDNQADAESTAEEAEQQVVDAIGVDAFEKYSNEYLEGNGELSAESYEELASKYNFSKELVDSFIQGQEALLSNNLNEIQQLAGGEKGYNEMAEWAASNLDEADLESFNNTIETGDAATVKLAVQGMHARYVNESGAGAPTLVAGGGKPTYGGYASKAEMIADMRKPEYKEDPAFRETVEKRLANTRADVI
jgi:hypothetical protein